MKGRWATVSIFLSHKTQFKLSFKYLIISLSLVLFNYIYSIFAHGISSAYMTYAFLFPLVGGSLVSLFFIKIPIPKDLTKSLWRMGLSTLTVGSILKGVFDIYGSGSSLVPIFFVTGLILLATSIITYIIYLKK